MKLSYDLHIHTALSPCCDNDMTPNNIVNMALLKGLDVIAITDHNSCKNARSVIEAGKDSGLIILPGMEVETSEAIHVLCLFNDIDIAEGIEKLIIEELPSIKNKVNIYGNQLIMNSNDEVLEDMEQLLVISSGISIYRLINIVCDVGGVAIPAHIDRSSYSIIAALGSIPQDLNVKLIEISQEMNVKDYLEHNNQCRKYTIIQSSDAHYLEDISEPIRFIDVNEKSAKAVIKFLCSNC